MKSRNIAIADLGGHDLSLPMIEHGSGRPEVLIINNLHGNEITGFYVLDALLRELPNSIQGRLRIIPCANLLGLVAKQRANPLDGADLNRGFPPSDKERGVQAAIKRVLLELSGSAQVLIDLHTFTRPSLSAVLRLPHPPKQSRTLERCLAVLNVETVIDIPDNFEERPVQSALGFALVQKGVTVIPIEFPPAHCVKDNAEIESFAAGLLSALAELGLMKKIVKREQHVPPSFLRQQVISDASGLFLPTATLRQSVMVGDVLGFLIHPRSVTKTPVVSPYRGMLFELAQRQMIVFGDKIATVARSSGSKA
ncbi:MAG: succinylglutamate desuccinylase/aspartoacylase family protein [bacterium]|nr:succinylglutamate desuccinylase/aspartoacylase family protein [bacterium]